MWESIVSIHYGVRSNLKEGRTNYKESRFIVDPGHVLGSCLLGLEVETILRRFAGTEKGGAYSAYRCVGVASGLVGSN